MAYKIGKILAADIFLAVAFIAVVCFPINVNSWFCANWFRWTRMFITLHIFSPLLRFCPTTAVPRLEGELRRLKSELQSLRALEIELRTQVQQLTASERTYRSESAQARQESESLQTKLNQLTQRLQVGNHDHILCVATSFCFPPVSYHHRNSINSIDCCCHCCSFPCVIWHGK